MCQRTVACMRPGSLTCPLHGYIFARIHTFILHTPRDYTELDKCRAILKKVCPNEPQSYLDLENEGVGPMFFFFCCLFLHSEFRYGRQYNLTYCVVFEQVIGHRFDRFCKEAYKQHRPASAWPSAKRLMQGFNQPDVCGEEMINLFASGASFCSNKTAEFEMSGVSQTAQPQSSASL